MAPVAGAIVMDKEDIVKTTYEHMLVVGAIAMDKGDIVKTVF